MKTRILPPTDKTLEEASALLKMGGLVALPTETVYGLGANAWDAIAVARVFEAKERPSFDPLIVHVSPGLLGAKWKNSPTAALESAGIIRLASWDAERRELADRLLAGFWPGPLTLILPKSDRIPDLVTAGLPDVGVRMPAHDVARKLIDRSGFPIAAPSANRFGKVSPTRATDVVAELDGKIELVIDGGAADIGVESTVVRIGKDQAIEVLRPGGTSNEELYEKTGAPVKFQTQHGIPHTRAKASPGLSHEHYAPKKNLHLVPKRWGEALDRDLLGWIEKTSLGTSQPMAFLLTSGSAKELEKRLASLLPGRKIEVWTLSESGDAREAARNLFAMLRTLDSSDAELLLAEPCPDQTGLWLAISDRINRAARIKFPV